MPTLLLGVFLFGHQPTPRPLDTAAVRLIATESGAEVAVAFRMLDGSGEMFIEPDKPFHAASTMKIPVMIELFGQVAAGQVSLEDQLTIRNEFRSIVDGSTYALSVEDDSDREVYAAVGRTMTLRQLCELMITVSSNFATNLLIEKLGVEKIRATVTRLGADGMQVLRGVEDDKAFQKGLNNSTTARALLTLLERIANGKAIDPTSDAKMVEILKRQKFNEGIPAGVPRGIAVAHKTGNITRINHDAAIVYAPRPYVLVVLVRGIEDEKKSAALIAEISRALYPR
jgi:beta-lactamase class A